MLFAEDIVTKGLLPIRPDKRQGEEVPWSDNFTIWEAAVATYRTLFPSNAINEFWLEATERLMNPGDKVECLVSIGVKETKLSLRRDYTSSSAVDLFKNIHTDAEKRADDRFLRLVHCR